MTLTDAMVLFSLVLCALAYVPVMCWRERLYKRNIRAYYASRESLSFDSLYEISQPTRMTFEEFVAYWRRLSDATGVAPGLLRPSDDFHEYPWVNRRLHFFPILEPIDLVEILSNHKATPIKEEEIPHTVLGIIETAWDRDKAGALAVSGVTSEDSRIYR